MQHEFIRAEQTHEEMADRTKDHGKDYWLRYILCHHSVRSFSMEQSVVEQHCVLMWKMQVQH